MGVQHGELTQSDARRVQLPYMRSAAINFALPLWHDLGNTVMDTDCLVKSYRTDPITNTKTLAHVGPVVSAEEVADETTQTIAVVVADPLWRLTKRLIPGSLAKAGIGYGLITPQDLGAMAHQILTEVNAVNYTGVSPGTLTNTITGSIGPIWLKNAAEQINELHAGLNSFEYDLDYVEPVSVGGTGGWPKLANMNIAPSFGSVKDDAVFEYGTTKANVAAYSRSKDRTTLLTRGICSVAGWPDGAGTFDLRIKPTAGAATLADAAVIARGLFEETINDAGVTDNSLRDTLIDFHLSLRNQPRQIITFRPVPNARPAPFVDYNVGDTVRCRAVVRGSVRFDAYFRIWGINFDIDANGNEMIELELAMS